ncbi:hypothetical protein ACVW02_004178 [Ewingella americana]
MSQEYTEDKDVTLKKLSSSRRVLEAVLVVVAVFRRLPYGGAGEF